MWAMVSLCLTRTWEWCSPRHLSPTAINWSHFCSTQQHGETSQPQVQTSDGGNATSIYLYSGCLNTYCLYTSLVSLNWVCSCLWQDSVSSCSLFLFSSIIVASSVCLSSSSSRSLQTSCLWLSTLFSCDDRVCLMSSCSCECWALRLSEYITVVRCWNVYLATQMYSTFSMFSILNIFPELMDRLLMLLFLSRAQD